MHAELVSRAGTESARYVHWGVVQISVTNIAIIAAMLVVFALALVLPFPGNSRAGQVDPPVDPAVGPALDTTGTRA